MSILINSFVVIFIFIILTYKSLALDLGTYGESFPIKEQDMAQYIKQKLNALGPETLQKHQEKIRDKIVSEIKRPRPVPGISKVTEPTRRYFDPSFVVEEDITDSRGNIIHFRGTTLNPLDYQPFLEEWIFIDGDDLEQVELAGKYKIVILVNGSPGEQFNRQFYYFDQGGALCKKMNINKVPTIIRQKGRLIELEEIIP